ncbi:tyrosine-type recombinase/integrase [Haloarcula argentinensis]|uniref:Tyrosine-type recombinase/integrase n=1 Tax=Haloarcula argentinensis TaxID=43776 RepID=A0A847U1J0_HALAR|nr:site-specific integrase [Haloarcula argentinensis]NLV12122.1 tyrosine-type recombinase/integrase [Haloarcula argentinensis]
MSTLEPITPSKALKFYIEDKRSELADATLRSHKSRLSQFLTWCNEQAIENLNNITGRDLHQYKIWRRSYNGGIKPVTLKTQMDTLRVFIRFAESIDAVPDGTSQAVQSPNLSDKANVRDVMLNSDKAEQIISYLNAYRYASREHITLLLAWRTMMRRGAIHALSLRDYCSQDEYIKVSHRPEIDCPIKNQADGERMVSLSSATCNVIDDWIEDQRPEVVDDYGYEPLLSTNSGRVHTATIAKIVYNWSRPCIIGDECPISEDPEECDYASYGKACECPESISPHAIRRGSITHHLQEDVPERVVSDRANVGMDTLERHYDQRSPKEKMEQRRKYLDDI